MRNQKRREGWLGQHQAVGHFGDETYSGEMLQPLEATAGMVNPRLKTQT